VSNRQVFPSSLFPLRGDLSAEAGATKVTVVGIQNTPVSPVAPLDQQVLKYIAADGQYEPTTSLPELVASVDLTRLHANASGTLYANALVSGQYDIGAYVVCTQSSSVGDIPGILITWTDEDTGIVETNEITSPTSGTIVGNYNSGTMRVSAEIATNINWATTGYVGYVAYGDVFYSLHLTAVLVHSN
jgi:hypothetical protein